MKERLEFLEQRVSQLEDQFKGFDSRLDSLKHDVGYCYNRYDIKKEVIIATLLKQLGEALRDRDWEEIIR